MQYHITYTGEATILLRFFQYTEGENNKKNTEGVRAVV